jgi:hypothetical protein
VMAGIALRRLSPALEAPVTECDELVHVSLDTSTVSHNLRFGFVPVA